MTDPVAPVSRLRPAPRWDGPYDDEIDATIVAPTQGALALAFPRPAFTRVPLRLVPPAQPEAWDDEQDDDALTPRDQLPDPRTWSARLAQAVLEVLAGSRPAAQLGPLATLDVLELLERVAGRLGHDRASRRPGGWGLNPRLLSVRVTEPLPSIAELCLVVDTRPRRRAIALRLEGRAGRWRCTALQVG